MVGLVDGCPESARPKTGKSKRQPSKSSGCRELEKGDEGQKQDVCREYTWAVLVVLLTGAFKVVRVSCPIGPQSFI